MGNPQEDIYSWVDIPNACIVGLLAKSGNCREIWWSLIRERNKKWAPPLFHTDTRSCYSQYLSISRDRGSSSRSKEYFVKNKDMRTYSQPQDKNLILKLSSQKTIFLRRSHWKSHFHWRHRRTCNLTQSRTGASEPIHLQRRYRTSDVFSYHQQICWVQNGK